MSSNFEPAVLPKVAIIYLSYHSEPYWNLVLPALEKLDYPKDRLELIIVDNVHPEHGSSSVFLEKEILPLSGNSLPLITLLTQNTNLGFAKGNSVGMQKALEHGSSYVYLHNQDGFMDSECLRHLVEAMEEDKTIGAAQSLVMLYPEIELINSAGNALNYLGFGYCNYYKKRKADVTFREITDIGYASGASLLLRADLVQKHGGLDEDFISYHEDLEYSLRLKSLGYKIKLVSAAVFFHEYSFNRNKDKYYLMERNRFATLLLYYKWGTLLLILPMALLMEIGLLFFSARQGWLKEKLRSYKYWLKTSHWQHWLQKRKFIQKQRIISDRKLLDSAVGTVEFGEENITNPVLKHIANPLMRIYWLIVKNVMIW